MILFKIKLQNLTKTSLNCVLLGASNITVRPCSGGKCAVGRDKEGKKEGRKEGRGKTKRNRSERKKASQDGL